MDSDEPTTLDESREKTAKSQDVTELIDGIPLVPQPSRDVLDPRHQLDYAEHRRRWLRWSLNVGKNPETAEGYSQTTIKSRSARVDQFFRWLWEDKGYTTAVTLDDADEYLQELAFSDYGQQHKSNTVKALRTYFDWRHHQHDADQWEPEYTFSSPNGQATSNDALSKTERKLIREAALEYGSVPHYNSVDPDERDRWKLYLAQRFEKPKGEVTKTDWERANDWKIPSLVWTSLDAALRPVEVERAKVSWVDLDRGRLVIPADEAAKTKGNDERRKWTPVLTDKTVEALQRWLKQRACYDRYEGTDRLWLTRHENTYGSNTLSYVIKRLCEIADIDTSNRQVSWYSIRRGTVTELVNATDLSTAAEQVRHQDIRSTRRYDQAPEHRRRDALEQIE